MSYYNRYPAPVRRRRKPRLFTKEIEYLLYSLGDEPVSLESTINTLDDCLTEYLTDLSQKTLAVARAQGRNRIKIGDLPFALKDDPAKLSRMNYIRELSAKVEKARKMFDSENYGGLDEDEAKREREAEKEAKRKKRKIKQQQQQEEEEEESD